MPRGLAHDLLLGDPPIARFFLSRGWPSPTIVEHSAGDITYATLIFQP